MLGKRLIAQFQKLGHSALGLARDSRSEQRIQLLGGESRRADLFDADSLARAAEGAEVIVHAATAIPKVPKPRGQDWAANDRIRREGTRALAECAKRVGARALLVQSITWVAQPEDGSAFDESSPLHPDAVTQSAADMEEIAREAGARHGFHVAVLRFAWFHCPDSWHTRYFGEQLLANKLPIIGKGEALWSFIHADDAAAAMVAAARSDSGGLWHVTDNQPVLAGEYLKEFARRLGAKQPRRIPALLARVVLGRQAAKMLMSSTRTGNDRFRRDFQWSPQFPRYDSALDQIVTEWRRENFLGLGSRIAA